ncbi:trans-aconitate methyltransferase [Streptomyces abyssalis]|uniref:Trans-aconitate methyltransferase n=1 Tax=Streptomyces abyssalis TaxID=933944 RepID=A0A1E7JSX8_9ACTN|nr:class I SAM-dependent methyltransferase [Streptomyces abyssalis]OEU91967.1 trans-aconitate methyltransferase [Streptomyces abyssalis]OEU93890.1 trans-aconitate methyltransferase [Streptomyces abyssalis]
MNTVGSPRYAPEWLALREDADARARAEELIGPLNAFLADTPASGDRLTVHDLGCGTGSMGRWLSARLGGPQRWFMYDRDPALLENIAARMPREAGDGSPLEVVPQQRDITRLTGDDLAGTSLVTASALLDLLTADEVESLAASCAAAGCAVLLALSVEGRVELEPSDPLDEEFAAAFDAHQRRADAGRRLLGPDAAEAATAAFERNGFSVLTRSSPWQLGPQESGLTAQWLLGWVAAACAQEPSLEAASEDYLRRRLDSCEAGTLRAVVHHRDLLALPGGTAGTATA